MNCPHCGLKGATAGHIMGHGGKGKPKAFSKTERKRRSDRMKALNVARRAESQNNQAQAQPPTATPERKGDNQ